MDVTHSSYLSLLLPALMYMRGVAYTNRPPIFLALYIVHMNNNNS